MSFKNKARIPTLNASSQQCIGGSVQCNKAKKQINTIQTGEETVKLTLFVNGLIIYTKISNTAYKKNILEIMLSEVSKFAEHKVNTESIVFQMEVQDGGLGRT